MQHDSREQQHADTQAQIQDVAIIGGGVNGAAIFRELADSGLRTLLVDSGDFCARTSQASGQLIWGGLLYLKSLELRTVRQLCAERDRLILADPEQVRSMHFRYMPLRGSLRRPWIVRLALQAYWLLGGRRRIQPRGEASFQNQHLIAPGRFHPSLLYEEAGVVESDCRYVSSWIFSRMSPEQRALNHCSLEEARWDTHAKLWVLRLMDRLTGNETQVRSRVLINAAGIWVDKLNEIAQLRSPFRHVLSKGMYLNLPCPKGLSETLVFETEVNGESLTLTPWGPVAMWGPTEEIAHSITDGYTPNQSDLRFLIDQAGNNLRPRPQASDVISMRCGIRPLAIKRSYRRAHLPLTISRRHLVARDRNKPALMIYGGKITSAPKLARDVLSKLAAYDLPKRSVPTHQAPAGPAAPRSFGSLAVPQPDPAWCRDQEACVTLEDYLRRRSNIAQWIPRLGLGPDDCHRAELEPIARIFHGEAGAQAAIDQLGQAADRQDRLLASL
ncbi:MAG: glycerol-3-phosphate dehydrogenase [Planctomycetota bacterium]